MSRQEIPIEPAKVEKLAAAGLTVEEIAAVLDCSKRTIERRFDAPLKRGRLRMNACLKRKQFQVAMKGSVPMLIWLGKQHLGQSDKQTISGDTERPLMVKTLAGLDDGDLDHLARIAEKVAGDGSGGAG